MERLTKGNGVCAWALHNGLWLEPNELAIERDNVHTIGDLMRRLAAYEVTGHTPDEIQKATFPPCKVGDTVYKPFLRPLSVVPMVVLRIVLDGNDNQIIVDGGRSFCFNDIGKTLFLTSKEAEAALKKESKGEHNEANL